MAGEVARLKDGRWGCTWPECDYTHKRPGAVRLHYYAKHRRDLLKLERKVVPVALDDLEAPPAGAAPVRVNSKCGRPGCAGVYRLLVDSDPAEAAARRDGWRLICPECGRLSE